jgi:hypothetical protein
MPPPPAAATLDAVAAPAATHRGKGPGMSTQAVDKPGYGSLERAARRGLWALPVWAVLLLVGTITHQPPPQTQLGNWSRYVTTPWFLASHLVASLLGAAIGTVGLVALAICLAGAGRTRGAVWGMVLGIIANTLVSALFGIAAFAQPAIGRLYLTGHTALARVMYDGAAQGGWLEVTGITGVVLLTASLIVFGVTVARSGSLPRAAGIGLAVGGPLFAIVGFALDDFIETIAAALLVACTAWIAAAARHAAAPAATAGAGLAGLAG